MADIWKLREALEKKYGKTIRGRLISEMSDGQILAIYSNSQNRKPKKIEGQMRMDDNCPRSTHRAYAKAVAMDERFIDYI